MTKLRQVDGKGKGKGGNGVSKGFLDLPYPRVGRPWVLLPDTWRDQLDEPDSTS